MDIVVTGAGELKRLGDRLKREGEKGLQKELRRGVAKAVRPLQKSVKAEMGTYLPSGYTPVLRKALRLRTSNRSGGVRINAVAAGKKRRRAIAKINAGVLRHPVFGHYSRPWVDQAVTPDFFYGPLRRGAPVVRDEIQNVMREIASRIANG